MTSYGNFGTLLEFEFTKKKFPYRFTPPYYTVRPGQKKTQFDPGKNTVQPGQRNTVRHGKKQLDPGRNFGFYKFL